MKLSLVFNLKHSGHFWKMRANTIFRSLLFLLFAKLFGYLGNNPYINPYIVQFISAPLTFAVTYRIIFWAKCLNNLDSGIISLFLNCSISRWLHIKFDRLFFFLIPQEDELKKAILMVFANKQVPFYFSYNICSVSRATNACDKCLQQIGWLKQ